METTDQQLEFDNLLSEVPDSSAAAKLARKGRARALSKLRREKKAAELSERSELVDLLGKLGMAKCYYGDYEEAISYCRRALQLEPTETFLREYLVISYMHLEEYASAKDLLIDALRDNSEEVWAYTWLALHYSKVESNLEMARKLLIHALEIEPCNILANNNLGFLYAEEGLLGEALTHFDAILVTEPSFARAHYMRVMIYLEECQYSEASVAFDQLMEKADISDAEDAELVEEAKRSFSTQSLPSI